jgi:trimethylamine---corrinoid protein Co-methyltransferase
MRKQPQLLEILTGAEVERIHEASLTILEEVGVRFPNRNVLNLFAAAGAQVDFDGQVVRTPAALVEQALAALPKDFSVVPPDGGPPIRLGDGELKLSMDCTDQLVDLRRNVKYRGTEEDVLRGIAVANALPNVRLATGYCLPHEVPQYAGDVVGYQLLFTYSRKAIANWIYSARSADYVIEMAKVVAGSAEELKRRKLLTYFAEPVSPLRYAPHTLEIMLKMAQYECPIYLGPMVTTGGSGPGTLAGTLAMHNAEILQGLTLVYLLNPRQPVIYSCHAHTLDMCRAVTQYGAPEQALLACAAAQIARRYGLAVCGNVGLTDSNLADYQAGFEAGSTAAYALAAGWDMLGFIGFGTIGVVGNGVGHSLELVVIQDEALSYLKRLLASFEVTDETLALDIIREAGIGGAFLDHPHTARHVRSEFWRNGGIFTREDYQTWANQGAASTLDRAAARLDEILRRGSSEPVLDPAAAAALREIRACAVREATELGASYADIPD